MSEPATNNLFTVRCAADSKTETTKTDVRICYLADEQQVLPALGEHLYNEWP